MIVGVVGRFDLLGTPPRLILSSNEDSSDAPDNVAPPPVEGTMLQDIPNAADVVPCLMSHVVELRDDGDLGIVHACMPSYVRLLT